MDLVQEVIDETSFVELKIIKENVYILKDRAYDYIDILNARIDELKSLCPGCPMELREYNGSVSCLACNIGSQISNAISTSVSYNGAICNLDKVLELI